MMFFRPLAFILLLFSTSVYAQQTLTVIHGHVTDQDKHPVPYATVRLAGKAIATAANESGEFSLYLPARQNQDTLEVSAVGYRTRKLALDLAKTADITIVLPVNNISLRMVSVTYRDPLKIINKAIGRIPVNYISAPHVIRGFYRETTMKGKTPLQVSEAVFDIFNYGYSDPRQDLFRLVKARDDKNQRDLKGIEFWQSPGGLFNDDIVKRLKNSDILGKEGIQRHHYEVNGLTEYNGRPAYEITFVEKQPDVEHTFRGRILIDTASYAFVYFDYGMSPYTLKKTVIGSQRLMMKLMGVDMTARANREQIGYQRLDGRWVLASVVGYNNIYLKWPRKHYDFPMDVGFHYVVTQVDTTQQIPFAEAMRSSEHLTDHDTNEGVEFWKDYNVMLPDRNTEALIKTIRAINQADALKPRFELLAKKLPNNPALRLDSLLTFYHANGQFNGTALVSSQGKTLLSKSYGWANQENRTPAGEHTTYRIGSVAKSFTGVLINQLMAEGKLDVHAPVKTYLPWYVHGNVTLEQLLTHQSGIPDYFNNDDHKARLLSGSYGLREVVEQFCSDTLEFRSGTAFSYSNANFTVLALVAQTVSGQPFAQLLKERIFTPAGMNDTFFGSAAGHSMQATGYNEGVREALYDPANRAGAGGISSSAADLLKFHAALQQNKLLGKAATDTMLKPRVEFKDYGAWYDYGWMTDKDYFDASRKHTIVYHPGTDLGFYTMYLRIPDTDTCLILLNNTGDFPRYDLAELTLNILYR